MWWHTHDPVRSGSRESNKSCGMILSGRTEENTGLLIKHPTVILFLFIPVPLVRAISISGLSLLEVSSTVVIIDSILVSIGWRLNKIRGNIGRDSNKGPAGAAVANQGCQQPSSVTLRYYQASSAS